VHHVRQGAPFHPKIRSCTTTTLKKIGHASRAARCTLHHQHHLFASNPWPFCPGTILKSQTLLSLPFRNCGLLQAAVAGIMCCAYLLRLCSPYCRWLWVMWRSTCVSGPFAPVLSQLQVAVGDVAVDFCVSPVLASILAPFQQHAALTADQLAAEVCLLGLQCAACQQAKLGRCYQIPAGRGAITADDPWHCVTCLGQGARC
jgi:hypothetical protein